MPVYRTSFEGNAPANRVWETLTTLDRYPDWNPQIPQASGDLSEGGRINLRLALPGRPAMDLSMGAQVQTSHDALNAALKSRAEAQT